MSEFQKVRTKADLAVLDQDEIVAGYCAGFAGTAEPGSAKSRSYWHGWRNGVADRSGVVDDAQRQLAREVVGKFRGLN